MSDYTQELDQLRSERAQIEYAGRLHWFHWFVVLASLILTLCAWYISKSQINQKQEIRFEREAQNVVELVSERMRKYEEALWAGVAAIHALGDEVSVDQWQVFASRLNLGQRYPGINGIGVIDFLPRDERAAYLQLHQQQRPGFSIYPEHERDVLFPIRLIEPLDKNRKALGLDIAHESNRFNAAMLARDTGRAQITGPIVLVQDEASTPGFLFYAPYYRSSAVAAGEQPSDQTISGQFLGLVYAPFIMKELMRGTLLQEKRRVAFSISDGDEPLYSEHQPGVRDYDPEPVFSKKTILPVYGRQWQFDIRTTQAFRTEMSQAQPLLILFGGITIDALLLVLFILLTRSNRRALSFASRVSGNYEARTQDLENMVNKLEVSNKELEQFAYVASHDLQEPLGTIMNFTGLLKEDYSEQLGGDGQTYINYITQASARMSLLIKSLLDYSRIGRDHEMSQVDLNQVLKDVLDDLTDLIQSSGARITVSELPSAINASEVGLRLLFQNLISNAIKFTAPGESAKVTVSAERRPNEWCFYVQDEGIGIDQKDLHKVFAIFSRLNSHSKYAGTGIGLANSRKVVELHGGLIGCESKAGQGSRFYFTIPMQ